MANVGTPITITMLRTENRGYSTYTTVNPPLVKEHWVYNEQPASQFHFLKPYHGECKSPQPGSQLLNYRFENDHRTGQPEEARMVGPFGMYSSMICPRRRTETTESQPGTSGLTYCPAADHLIAWGSPISALPPGWWQNISAAELISASESLPV